ncbi:MAG: flagellar basal body P-ring formation protein FlgA [Synergistaceae bacterium]|nr:flagellar basal body P-ring formation protein FlgA [Synergistaceae bacterium]
MDLSVNNFFKLKFNFNFKRRALLLTLRYFIILILIIFTARDLHAARTARIEIPGIIYIQDVTGAFRLGEIAHIEADANTRAVLDNLILAAKPEVINNKSKVKAQRYVLTRENILNAVKSSGLEGTRIELKAPAKILVERPMYEGNETESEPDFYNVNNVNLNNLVKSLAAWDGDVEVSSNMPVPPGVLVDPASIVPGTAAATLKFRDYKNKGRIKSISVRMTWRQNVLVAARTIPRDKPIRPQDLMRRSMKITRPGVYAVNESEVVNNISRKPIKQGEPIELALLSGPNNIKKGTRVKIIARLGSIIATSEGVLAEDGQPGDLVNVKVASSQNRRKFNIIKAYIINENTVEAAVN